MDGPKDIPARLLMTTTTTSFRTEHQERTPRPSSRHWFVLDARASLPSVRRLRDRALGEVAVDVGFVTGEEARRLVLLVGDTGRARPRRRAAHRTPQRGRATGR